jgi:hypothetical protein
MLSADFGGERPRFKQLTEWLRPDFDGVIAFDANGVISWLGEETSSPRRELNGVSRLAFPNDKGAPNRKFRHVAQAPTLIPRA